MPIKSSSRYPAGSPFWALPWPAPPVHRAKGITTKADNTWAKRLAESYGICLPALDALTSKATAGNLRKVLAAVANATHGTDPVVVHYCTASQRYVCDPAEVLPLRCARSNPAHLFRLSLVFTGCRCASIRCRTVR